MAGSPKKATKKKATKAKADKPKRPLSGYMKFVKGEYIRNWLLQLEENDGTRNHFWPQYFFGPAFALMPFFEQKWSGGCRREPMTESVCNIQQWYLGP